MLILHYTEKLIDLQSLIVKNVVQDKFSTTIFAQMPRKPHKCPCCNTSTDKIHDYRKQRIKDIPAFGKFTNIVLRKRFYEDISFLPRYHRITNRLAAFVINKLKCEYSFKSVAESVNLSVSSVIRIFDIVSFPKPNKLPRVFAIDEFKGNTGKIKYQCIVTAPASGRVIDILPERSQQYLIDYLKQWNTKSRKRVKYFVSDMWTQYTDIVSVFFKNVTQVIDRYYFMRQIIWAFYNIRKRIQKIYGKQYRLLLKHLKRLLIKRTAFRFAQQSKDLNKKRQISTRNLSFLWWTI